MKEAQLVVDAGKIFQTDLDRAAATFAATVEAAVKSAYGELVKERDELRERYDAEFKYHTYTLRALTEAKRAAAPGFKCSELYNRIRGYLNRIRAGGAESTNFGGCPGHWYAEDVKERAAKLLTELESL